MENLKNVRKFPSFNQRIIEFTKGNGFGNIDSIILLYIMDFVSYCGKNKSYGGNTIAVTKEFRLEMMHELGVNQDNISQAFHRFYEAGVLYKIKNGLYQFNPWLVARGSDEDVNWLRRYGVFPERVTVFETFRHVDDIISIMNKDIAQTSKQLKESGIPIPNSVEVCNMLKALKLITEEDFMDILNNRYKPKKKSLVSFEKVDKLLAVAEERIRKEEDEN